MNVRVIQQINHHSPLNPPSTHSHHTSQPKLTHSHSFSKNTPNPLTFHTTQTNSLTQTPLSQPHSPTTFPSISLTILETPILPYKSTLFQSTPNPSTSPYHFPYIIYKVKPCSIPNQSPLKP